MLANIFEMKSDESNKYDKYDKFHEIWQIWHIWLSNWRNPLNSPKIGQMLPILPQQLLFLSLIRNQERDSSPPSGVDFAREAICVTVFAGRSTVIARKREFTSRGRGFCGLVGRGNVLDRAPTHTVKISRLFEINWFPHYPYPSKFEKSRELRIQILEYWKI